MSLIFDAIDDNDAANLERLLKEGHDTEVRAGNWSMTPLCRAAHGNKPALVRLLLKYGADPNAQDSDGETPLFLSLYNDDCIEVIEALIGKGANPAIRNKAGCSVHEKAAEKGQDYVNALLPKSDRSAQVIFNLAAGNRLMQEIYHFDLLERITYIRQAAHGPVESFLRESFSDLAGSSRLRQAYQEHLRHGGTRTEMEVFGGLSKRAFIRKI